MKGFLFAPNSPNSCTILLLQNVRPINIQSGRKFRFTHFSHVRSGSRWEISQFTGGLLSLFVGLTLIVSFVEIIWLSRISYFVRRVASSSRAYSSSAHRLRFIPKLASFKRRHSISCLNFRIIEQQIECGAPQRNPNSIYSTVVVIQKPHKMSLIVNLIKKFAVSICFFSLLFQFIFRPHRWLVIVPWMCFEGEDNIILSFYLILLFLFLEIGTQSTWKTQLNVI